MQNSLAPRRLASVLVVGAFAIATIAVAKDFPQPVNTEKSPGQSMSPEEVCRTARLPPGFKLSAFAAEPNVQNPIAISTDDRGRLWVAENYTWAGQDAGNFDPNQRDRLVILDDTDGDGKFDKRTVFYDELTHLTSVQVGLGGVWLICAPHLLFIPDRNHDDIPDGPPEVLLDGFDLKTSTHTVANGLKWGPDGWLYGRQGILGTSNIGVPGADNAHRVTMNTGIWRYHPQRHVVEVVMHGMTNPWGFDYDPFGEIFVTNTVIGHLWHVVPGGRTERMSGSDFNAYAYQLLSQVADHVHWNTSEVWMDVRKGVTDRTSAAGGGHAHTGLMIYQGDNWPAEYRGRAYINNIHGQRLNCDILQQQPVGYVATHSNDMCFIADPWYRPMDVISGADGGVFLADWSDTGECHEMGGVHRTSGRIYKLTYGDPARVTNLDLTRATLDELVNLQSHANDWYARRACLVMQERAAAGTLDKTACQAALLKLITVATDPVVRLRAMWALYLTGSVDENWLVKQLSHADEHIRVWAVRFLADSHGPQDTPFWQSLNDKFVSLAENDRSGLVLLYVASALQKMPVDARWRIGEALAIRTDTSFADNRALGIMTWIAIEPCIAERPDSGIALLKEATSPLIRENIAHRLAAEIDHSTETVAQLLTLAVYEPKLKPDILRGIAAAVAGRKNPPIPTNWKQVAAKLKTQADESSTASLNTIGVAFNDSDTIASLRRTVENQQANPDLRAHALQLLLTAHPKDFSDTLRELLHDPALASDAIRGLAAYEDSQTPITLLKTYPHLTADQRAAAISTLASRVSYAQTLLSAIESKQLHTTDISAVQARQLVSLGNAAISDRVRALWGDVRQTSGEKQEMMSRLRSVLIPTLTKADLDNGKTVFTKTCATCHTLFGQGAKIGPDLTGSNRKNLDYVLENILDPSAIVAAEFRAKTLTLSDGRVLTGIIREQNDKTITIETADSKQIIDRQQIDETNVSDKSLMPDGLLQPLTSTQVRDLIGYVMSD